MGVLCLMSWRNLFSLLRCVVSVDYSPPPPPPVDDACGGFGQSPCGVPIRSPCAPSAARCWRACHMPHASMRVKESKPVFPIHVCVAFQEQHLRVQH